MPSPKGQRRMPNGRIQVPASQRFVTAEEIAGIHEKIDTLEGSVASIQALGTSMQRDMVGVTGTLDKLTNRVEAMITTSSSKGMISLKEMWQGIGGLAVVLGAFTWLVTNQAGQAITPIANRVVSLEEKVSGILPDLRLVQQKADASATKDAESSTNRADMGRQIELLRQTQANINADLRALIAKVDATGIEIETQFKGQSNIENLRWIDEHRRYAVIFEKVFGFSYPSGGFFPPSNFRDPQK